MKLYGSTTSPFARRVRIVAEEIGAPISEMVSSLTDEGQAALRKVTPIWKVPVAEVDGMVIFDSHVIVDYLIAKHGHGPLRAPVAAERWREANIITVVDGALDACLQVRYMRLDGVDAEKASYLVKHQERTRSAMAWLERELRDGYFTAERRVGLAEIALATALDWMVFRDLYPVSQSPILEPFRRTHAERPSFASTVPKL